ncbi:MAG TPA: hypothetical protein PLP61_15740 [Nocardioides sp.]|nr:hypothetical protein [Nocardioides sp.]HQR28495.1 hypothetical protein [Nocardioides sp.]
MNTQLHLAYGIVAGRAWSAEDRALLRSVELARKESRRNRRERRDREH